MINDNKASEMMELVTHLREKGVLQTETIMWALLAINRADFVPAEFKSRAYEDAPLPLRQGSTISQPYTTVFILELLDVQEGHIIMEVGHGSCWKTALLASLVGTTGKVFSFEVVPELCSFGRTNLGKYPILNDRVTFYCKNAKKGVPDMENMLGDRKLNRIVTATDVPQVPVAWREQLAPGGIMIYPSGQSIYRERKNMDGTFDKEEFPGFSFVPFIEEE